MLRFTDAYDKREITFLEFKYWRWSPGPLPSIPAEMALHPRCRPHTGEGDKILSRFPCSHGEGTRLCPRAVGQEEDKTCGNKRRKKFVPNRPKNKDFLSKLMENVKTN